MSGARDATSWAAAGEGAASLACSGSSIASACCVPCSSWKARAERAIAACHAKACARRGWREIDGEGEGWGRAEGRRAEGRRAEGRRAEGRRAGAARAQRARACGVRAACVRRACGVPARGWALTFRRGHARR